MSDLWEFEHFGGDLWTLRGLGCTTLEGSAEDWCALADALMCGGGEAGGYRCRARWVTRPGRVSAITGAPVPPGGLWELWSPRNAVSSEDRARLTRGAAEELWRTIAAHLFSGPPGEPTHAPDAAPAPSRRAGV